MILEIIRIRHFLKGALIRVNFESEISKLGPNIFDHVLPQIRYFICQGE